MTLSWIRSKSHRLRTCDSRSMGQIWSMHPNNAPKQRKQ